MCVCVCVSFSFIFIGWVVIYESYKIIVILTSR